MGNCLRSHAETELAAEEKNPWPIIDVYDTKGQPSPAENEAKDREEIIPRPCLKSYSFNELKIATGGFRKDHELGEGGFGPVYMGWVHEHSLEPVRPGSGMAVAIKMLRQEGFQGYKQWEAEVKYLGKVNHPNLVKLIGYCSENDQRLLVYEYMPRGSLEDHLYDDDPNTQPLSWSRRLNIALGAARGLAYLHQPDIKIIHRDFKTSNILLDVDFNTKLSDFGLVIEGPNNDKTHLSLSRVFGTYGYVDPMYMNTCKLTAKSDVYGFGVVLLEILSGRRALDCSKPRAEHELVKWAMPYFKNKLHFLNIVMDKRIYGQYSQNEALKVAQIAGLCLSYDRKQRPNMSDVVTALEFIQGGEGSS
ncbi:probable serine/threonine-protein kinase PBL10 [Asparagus officinalis]|uniref:probable serine/threonine-protein kinase PBL10 n=1 Tax=Asparagus officinalis TaxID=4686 RepID=UPI00098E2ECE|nr:probable serine/threonine-protein kinase PBL10 [Asparagus officinalis]